MTERELTAEETAQVYKEICDANIQPFSSNYERKYSEFFYEHNGKQYRLIYDPAGDWFCDIIYEGIYTE